MLISTFFQSNKTDKNKNDTQGLRLYHILFRGGENIGETVGKIKAGEVNFCNHETQGAIVRGGEKLYCCTL